MYMTGAIWWTIWALTLDQNHADSAQILSKLPFAAKSHWNVVDVVLQTLVASGHNVTATTPLIKNRPVANYTEVGISQLTPLGVSVPWDVIMESSEANNLPFLSGRHKVTCNKLFEYEKFWRIIKSNK